MWRAYYKSECPQHNGGKEGRDLNINNKRGNRDDSITGPRGNVEEVDRPDNKGEDITLYRISKIPNGTIDRMGDSDNRIEGNR